MLHVYSIQSTAQFVVHPVPVVQAEGLMAVFECRYPGAVTHRWGLNGVFLTDELFPPSLQRTLASGDTPATLEIPATVQYNNTVVQCRAVVEIGGGFVGKLSENSTFQVQGVSLCKI